MIGMALRAAVLLAAVHEAQEPRRITVLYDAFGAPSALERDWGFAALVEYGGRRILFDTGNDAAIFARNVKQLGVDLTRLDAVVISHRHGDHTTGTGSGGRRQSGCPDLRPARTSVLQRWGVEGASGARPVAAAPDAVLRWQGSRRPAQRYTLAAGQLEGHAVVERLPLLLAGGRVLPFPGARLMNDDDFGLLPGDEHRQRTDRAGPRGPDDDPEAVGGRVERELPGEGQAVA